ncbi:hypothetical protein KMW28_14870 [Flammeovirga yaeyamensis]|uniref:Uncharacterized protein n=1 Tax=Flammeovirga yaeyamensis TaxID=367791 RepID=A0AAX1N097_9BACT|nr:MULTISPECIES: hypothetical protein [Flammeovirga]ANQ47667.1 hypothetical protein MY04_0285 [Flammeovirga sp. MY04]MBB3700123.1 Ca2+/Na+ antiporter [Flammeovirga yaeyamensis]NMF37246.1 hypothetical protein [Flammeovirga yaeyamensis]QWG00934.1 hypothetical protein KMW28_14870 [Flammeovirga yaeyamensis]
MIGFLFTILGIITAVTSWIVFKDNELIRYSGLGVSFLFFVYGAYLKNKYMIKLKKEMNEKIEAAKKKKEMEAQKAI